MPYIYSDLPREDILRMIPADGKVIGSIGCGKAATEAMLAREGREVHGVDVSPEAVAVAATRIASARVIAPDDRRPFAPESLDGLILADVLEHVPKAWEALAAWSEAVRPGGWVVISAPNMRYAGALWRLVVRGDWPEEDAGIFDSSHVQVMTHRRLARWVRAAGLEIDRWHPKYGGGRRREKLCRALDLATFRLFRSFFEWQLQLVCRKPARR